MVTYFLCEFHNVLYMFMRTKFITQNKRFFENSLVSIGRQYLKEYN